MNILTRYMLVGIISASLVAPAQAFDLSNWFSSFSKRSQAAMYLGAATVVAGLGLLTYKLWNTKKVQPEVVNVVDDKEHAIKKLQEDKAGLTTQCENLEEQLRKHELLDVVRREAHQKKAQERKQHKEQLKATAQKIKGEIGQLKQDHAELKAAIVTELNSGLADIEQLFEKTRGAMQYKQERELAQLVRTLDEQEVTMIVFALENEDYTKLSITKELLLKSWSCDTRKRALTRLKNKQAHIEQKKKKEQDRQAAKERKKQELRDEETKVTAAMDKALAGQSNGNGKQHGNGGRFRPAVAKPVTRVQKV